MKQLTMVLQDLVFPEGLCWSGSELWFSDFGTRRVFSLDGERSLTERAYIPGQPSGIGFRPDGTPLVISMLDHYLLELREGDHPIIVADLTSACLGPANDMLVDKMGRTYFGAFGSEFTYEGVENWKPSELSMVTEAGDVVKVGEGLACPNGLALSEDGTTLIVAETFGGRLTSFTVSEDGTLSDKRLFADLGDRGPDGICMDSAGAIWAGCPFTEEFVRVADGGEILEVIPTPGRWAVSCGLGGVEGTTLFCATATTTLPDFHRGRSSGAIEAVEVDTPR